MLPLKLHLCVESAKQVSRLAKKIEGKNLEETCRNIHLFLYNYIQYEIDGVEQNLRSPANSWHVARKTGIDCKSYSIFASSLLINLGIKHYIRQIKQPMFNPKNFSHVYIIVPINQTTANLDEGYYVIDGTLKTNNEPKYTQAKDIFMQELPHIGLNGVRKKRSTSKKTSTKSTPRKGSTSKTTTTTTTSKKFFKW